MQASLEKLNKQKDELTDQIKQEVKNEQNIKRDYTMKVQNLKNEMKKKTHEDEEAKERVETMY